MFLVVSGRIVSELPENIWNIQENSQKLQHKDSFWARNPKNFWVHIMYGTLQTNDTIFWPKKSKIREENKPLGFLTSTQD